MLLLFNRQYISNEFTLITIQELNAWVFLAFKVHSDCARRRQCDGAKHNALAEDHI